MHTLQKVFFALLLATPPAFGSETDLRKNLNTALLKEYYADVNNTNDYVAAFMLENNLSTQDMGQLLFEYAFKWETMNSPEHKSIAAMSFNYLREYPHPMASELAEKLIRTGGQEAKNLLIMPYLYYTQGRLDGLAAEILADQTIENSPFRRQVYSGAISFAKNSQPSNALNIARSLFAFAQKETGPSTVMQIDEFCLAVDPEHRFSIKRRNLLEKMKAQVADPSRPAYRYFYNELLKMQSERGEEPVGKPMPMNKYVVGLESDALYLPATNFNMRSESRPIHGTRQVAEGNSVVMTTRPGGPWSAVYRLAVGLAVVLLGCVAWFVLRKR